MNLYLILQKNIEKVTILCLQLTAAILDNTRHDTFCTNCMLNAVSREWVTPGVTDDDSPQINKTAMKSNIM